MRELQKGERAATRQARPSGPPGWARFLPPQWLGVLSAAALVAALSATYPVRCADSAADGWRQVLATSFGLASGVKVVTEGADLRLLLGLEQNGGFSQCAADAVSSLRLLPQEAGGDWQPGAPRTWRHLDAALVECASQGGARVVVLDKHYARDLPAETEVLAAAIDRAVQRGTAVLVQVSERYPPPALLEREGRPLAVAGSANGLGDGFFERVDRISLSEEGGLADALVLQAVCIALHGTRPGEWRQGRLVGGDAADCVAGELARGAVLDVRFVKERFETIPCDRMLGWTADDLRSTMAEKTIFIGQTRGQEDLHASQLLDDADGVEDGKVYGVFLLAAAFQQLLAQARMTPVPGPLAAALFLLAGALPFFVRSRRWLLQAGISAVTVAALAAGGLLVPLLFPWGAAVAAGMAGAIGAAFVPAACAARAWRLARAARDVAQAAQVRGLPLPVALPVDGLPGLVRELGRPALAKDDLLEWTDRVNRLVVEVPQGRKKTFFEEIAGKYPDGPGFFARHGWLSADALERVQAAGRLERADCLEERFVGTAVRRIRVLDAHRDNLDAHAVALAWDAVVWYGGSRDRPGAAHWLTVQRRLAEETIRYLEELHGWLLQAGPGNGARRAATPAEGGDKCGEKP